LKVERATRSAVGCGLRRLGPLAPPQPSLQRQALELDEALEPMRPERERRAQRRPPQDEPQRLALLGLPRELVGLVAAQQVELVGAVGHRALQRLRHEHVADRIFAEGDVEAAEVVVDAPPELETIKGGARLAVETEPMQPQPAAL